MGENNQILQETIKELQKKVARWTTNRNYFFY